MRRGSLVFLTAVGCAVTSPDGTPDASVSLDAATAPDFAEWMDPILTPAIGVDPSDLSRCPTAIAVVVSPQGSRVRGYGAGSPDERTLFQIGSITKVFTGLALARLVEERQLDPSSQVSSHLLAPLTDALVDPPSLAALIAHQAGFPSFPTNTVDRDGDGMRDADADPLSPAKGYSREHLRAYLVSWRPQGSGTYRYSNVGLGLAAVALQDHLGLSSHHAALEAMVTSPLGLTSTYGEVAALPAEAQARVTASHALANQRRVSGRPGEMGVLAGAGEILTTGQDMERFLRALTGLEPTALEPSILRALTPLAAGPPGVQLGYAFEVKQRGGIEVYEKAGATSSFTAYLLFSRAPRVGVVVMSACGDFTEVGGLAGRLFDRAPR